MSRVGRQTYFYQRVWQAAAFVGVSVVALAVVGLAYRALTYPAGAGSAGPIRPSTGAVAYGLSMVFQIFVPLLTGLIAHQWGIRRRWLRDAIGFMSWKIGCDFGFFLAEGEDLRRAFHPAGLLFYTVMQLMVFHVVGQRVLRDRFLPAIGRRDPDPPSPTADSFRRFLSTYGCEYDGAPATNAPFGHIFLQWFIVFVGSLASWPAYDLGVNWWAGSGFNVGATYGEFRYELLITFTLVGYFAHIAAYVVAGNCYRLLTESEWREREEPSPERLVGLRKLLVLVRREWRAMPLAATLKEFRVGKQFLVERLVGVLVVSLLLPFFASRSFSRPEDGGAVPPAARSKTDLIGDALRAKLTAIDVDERKPWPELADDAPERQPTSQELNVVVRRLIFGAELGSIEVTAPDEKPENLVYSITDRWPELGADGNTADGTRPFPRDGRLVVDREAVVRIARRDSEGRLSAFRSIPLTPNTWEVKLAKLPERWRGRPVAVTGGFREWSPRADDAYRLIPLRDGSYGHRLMIDGSTRVAYKFVCDLGDAKYDWRFDPSQPHDGTGDFANNIVSPWTRLRDKFANRRDGHFEEAAADWELFEEEDRRWVAMLLTLDRDVEEVQIKFPGSSPRSLRPHAYPRDTVPLAAWGAELRLPDAAVNTGFCYIVRDGERRWSVGPRGALAWSEGDDAAGETALKRLAARDNLFHVRRVAKSKLEVDAGELSAIAAKREAEKKPAAQEQAAPREAAAMQAAKEQKTNGGGADEYDGGRADPRSRVVYFALVDRFCDGDDTNNNPPDANRKAFDGQGRFLRAYQGGDLAGLTQRADYFDELGVGMLWITPVCLAQPKIDDTQPTPNTGYHGYWALDFFEIEPRCGSWDDFDRLLRRLHKSDIQCMLDFVPNHSSPSYISGRLLERGKEVVESHYADGQLKPQERWYNHYGSMTAPGDSDRAPDRYLKDSAGLSDFNTDNPRVANYIRDAARFWVLEKGVDALRLDSIKHVDPDFLRRMCEDVAEEAYRKRNRELFIVGEWYGGGANEASSVDFVNHADHCELLDFGLYYELKKVLAGSQSMRVLDQHLNLRRQAFRGRESWQVTFMDNHDTRRIAVDLEDQGSGAGLPRALVHQRMDLGMALIMTLPGIPSIYYGTEQYLANFGEEWQGNSYMVGYEPFSRPMMPEDFKADTRMCRIIRTLADLRRRSIALQQAPYEERWLDDNTLVFQRAIGDDVVVVAANRGPPRSITVEQLKLADGEYRDLLAEKTAPPIQISGGAARLDLPREGVVVLSSHEKGDGGHFAK